MYVMSANKASSSANRLPTDRTRPSVKRSEASPTDTKDGGGGGCEMRNDKFAVGRNFPRCSQTPPPPPGTGGQAECRRHAR